MVFGGYLINVFNFNSLMDFFFFEVIYFIYDCINMLVFYFFYFFLVFGEYKEDLNVIFMCVECKEFLFNLIEEFLLGDMVCEFCGLVLGECIIDMCFEWWMFLNDD